MPHIIILERLKEILKLLADRAEEIQTNIDNGVYLCDPDKLAAAEALQNQAESLGNNIDASYGVQLDELTNAQKTFLS